MGVEIRYAQRFAAPTLIWLAGVFLAALALVPGAATASTTFTNSTAITVSASGTPNGVPYPSPMTVSGLTGAVTDVDVTLNGFSHTFSSDVGVVLVAPNGSALLLIDAVGGEADAVNANLTLDDGAAAQMSVSAAPVTGTYRPTAYYDKDSFPAPGPGQSYGVPAPVGTATLASAFNGINPNGIWQLFVRDFENGDGGSFAGGWSLTVDSAIPAAPTLTGTSPVSPADDNNPRILGTATSGTTVELFAAAGCAGAVIAKGSAAELKSPGIVVSVPDNSTTIFSARIAGFPGCSAPITYVELTPPPTLPVTLPGTTPGTTPVKTVAKKCKKGFQRKKVKGKVRCVKKPAKKRRGGAKP